jgi:hypothetical protein
VGKLMTAVLEHIRKGIRFLLAVSLWSHALFFLSVPAGSTTARGEWLHFTGSEVVVFALLLVLSFLTSSGFWRTVGNLAYIYFFPFVLLFYFFYAVGKVLLTVARWFNPKATTESLEPKPAGPVVLDAAQTTPPQASSSPSRTARFARAVSGPVRKFTLLWCLVLLITTHSTVLWMSLIVVLLHLGRTIVGILKLTLLSGPWFEKIGQAIRQSADGILSKLSLVTDQSPSSDELKNLWNQVKLFETGVRFLENEAVLLKWTWLFCTSLIVALYLYLAFLFSFAYYGVARVSGVSYSWPESFVTSLFIPFLITDLPRVVVLKLLGGIHCALIVTVGTGTVLNYFRTRLAPIRSMVTVVGVRLADQTVRQKYSILESKFGEAKTPDAAANATNSTPQIPP